MIVEDYEMSGGFTDALKSISDTVISVLPHIKTGSKAGSSATDAALATSAIAKLERDAARDRQIFMMIAGGAAALGVILYLKKRRRRGNGKRS